MRTLNFTGVTWDIYLSCTKRVRSFICISSAVWFAFSLSHQTLSKIKFHSSIPRPFSSPSRNACSRSCSNRFDASLCAVESKLLWRTVKHNMLLPEQRYRMDGIWSSKFKTRTEKRRFWTWWIVLSFGVLYGTASKSSHFLLLTLSVLVILYRCILARASKIGHRGAHTFDIDHVTCCKYQKSVLNLWHPRCKFKLCIEKLATKSCIWNAPSWIPFETVLLCVFRLSNLIFEDLAIPTSSIRIHTISFRLVQLLKK